ncbi:MAG: hypothetical protein H0X13_06705 [Ramlibacter sp.]|nr:hypothetical protein [Ramlibacter sp.]
MNKLSRLAAVWLPLAAAGAGAQSFCASDGLAQPTALLERFISADCQSCWSDSRTPAPGRRDLALDWIVPGSRGDDAPLSAAASRDSLARLRATGRQAPDRADSSRTPARSGQRRLRVAHGLPFNDYVGASIQLKPGGGGPWRAWLLLVETIPAGTEGTPVERNLVRNAFQPSWPAAPAQSKQAARQLLESRPMRIPDGANPQRLRVVGWVEDGQGRITAIAQSRCTAVAGKG